MVKGREGNESKEERETGRKAKKGISIIEYRMRGKDQITIERGKRRGGMEEGGGGWKINQGEGVEQGR